jgi:hypothetical protein
MLLFFPNQRGKEFTERQQGKIPAQEMSFFNRRSNNKIRLSSYLRILLSINTSSFIIFTLERERHNHNVSGESRACSPNKRYPSPAQSAGVGGWGVRDKINMLFELDRQLIKKATK